MDNKGFKLRSNLVFPKAFFPVGKKGFNLFTALISFLLIMLAVLLVQSMIQTERNAADTIAKIESRSKLEATAEMSRADAMQVFNYALRKKIEDWLSNEETGVVQLTCRTRHGKKSRQSLRKASLAGLKEASLRTLQQKALRQSFTCLVTLETTALR